MSIKDRFLGPENRERLISALSEQALVEHSRELAEALADQGELVEFEKDQTIIEQGASDNDAYFILSGEATVFVNHREVEVRTSKEVVGEYAVIESSAPRSATLKARNGNVVAWKVSADRLVLLGEKYSSIWRVVAKAAHETIRRRERFHRPKNERPVMFIGSSTEGLEIARAVQKIFKHDDITAEIWTDGIFTPGGVPIDDLLKKVNNADFALFVFSQDDIVISRKDLHEGPRDNVIFELGLFMARLGRYRTFLLREHKTELKIPTDLLGITPLTYVHVPAESLATQLGPPCDELRNLLKGHGAL